MKVVVVGATGHVGSRLVTELLSRGHKVVGVSRNVPDQANEAVEWVAGDASYPTELAAKLLASDALISAAGFATGPSAADILSVVRSASIGRLLVVGGAGSLEVSPGVRLLDTPTFPEAYKPEAVAGGKFLDDLRGTTDVAWTFLSPSIDFAPGTRTTHFRLGHDAVLFDADGNSAISMEDYAIAMVDEVEKPEHTGERFTVGY